MSWSSVTEADPRPDERERRAEPPSSSSSSFHFDLGSALARLGDGPEPETEPARSPEPADEALAARLPSEPAPEPADEPLTARLPSEPAPEPTDEPLTARLPSEPARSPEPADEALPSRLPAEPEPADDLPRRGIGDVAADSLTDRPPPAADDAEQQADDPLPRRSSASAAPSAPTPAASAASTAPPVDPTPSSMRRPSSSAASQRSVFEDAAPAPSLPSSSQSTRRVEPEAPYIPAATAAGLPTLPEVNPAAPPPLAEPVATAPATPDINAVRSYQLRAQRDERRSKIFGRTLLAVLVLGGAVAAALIFGRSYLFPTQWDAELVPTVDRIQEARGAEFDGTVSLTVLPDGEYAAVALEIVLGPEWDQEMPAWRALGIASGSSNSDVIHRAVIDWRPALYDPVTETVYRATNAEPEALAAAYAVALGEVFDRQQATPPNTTFTDEPAGVLGVSSPQAISSQAIDAALRGQTSSGAALLDDSQAPLPLLYQFAAIDRLGAPLLALPEAQGVRYGDAYPESVLTAVSAPAIRSVSGLAPAGTESFADPVALGPDAWAMVWENRLPVRTVERLTTLISADSYRPVTQGATRCFVANFQATSDSAAGEVLGALARWTVAAPETAGAVATLVAPNRVELFACDPGAAVDQPVNPAAVASVLATQTARLAGS